MSENKFIKRLKGEQTAKSVLEIKNESAKTSFANMPQGTSNAINVYSDHRGNATAVLNGTTNWKVSNSELLLADTVSGDGQDFISTYSVSGTGLWVNANYTFPSTGDPNHPVAAVFNPSTKWVLKLCGDNLIVDGGNVVDFTLIVKIGSAHIFSKNFKVTENAGQFSTEFILDFEETNTGIVKAGGLAKLTLQLLCGTKNASARIYNGMTVLTCLQRKVDASAVSSKNINVQDVLDGTIIPDDYFSNPEFIDQIEDGNTAVAIFARDGDDVNLDHWEQPIPNRTGNAGKFLQTPDGNKMSWEDVEISDVTGLQTELNDLQNTMDLHIADTNNPHSVTKAQVGLGNVDNTSDLNKPISTATQTALNGKQATISDLATIRSNAQAGKSASNTIATYGNIVTHNVSEFATSAQGAKADTAIQPVDLATVATTGQYSDLSGKPTIPTVGNGTITITQGGVSKGTFTTNQSGNTTIELEAGAGDVYSKTETNALLDNKANTDMDNLTSAGANIANWSSNVTNCITNIPQDIKLELNNGTLTLKAGSKVYVPNGVGNFDELVIQNDLTTISSWGEQVQLGLFVKSDGSTMFILNMSERVSSGSTPPTATNIQMWYDTTNNLVKRYTGGADTGDRYSLPIALVQKGDAVESSNISSIDQVFNGFGYIGSTEFVLPNVGVLIPNGRNADRTLKNIKYTTTQVVTRTINGNTPIYIAIKSNGDLNWWNPSATRYDANQNLNYYNNVKQYAAVVGKFDVSNGQIQNFTPYNTFHAVDYSDTEYIAHQAMPSNRYVDLTVGSAGATYVAPADGYFHFLGRSKSQYGNIAISIKFGGIELISSNNYCQHTNSYMHITIPVSKGQTAEIGYFDTDTLKLRFVYANGGQ